MQVALIYLDPPDRELAIWKRKGYTDFYLTLSNKMLLRCDKSLLMQAFIMILGVLWMSDIAFGQLDMTVKQYLLYLL